MRLASLLAVGVLAGALLVGCGSNSADDSSTAATPPAGGGAAASGGAATPGTTGAGAAGKPAGVMTKNSVSLPASGGESNVGTKAGGG